MHGFLESGIRKIHPLIGGKEDNYGLGIIFLVFFDHNSFLPIGKFYAFAARKDVNALGQRRDECSRIMVCVFP